jgi:hypothetical protein
MRVLEKTVINHIASDGESLLFEVKVEYSQGERFTIVVKDDNGNEWYGGSFNGKDFSKKSGYLK